VAEPEHVGQPGVGEDLVAEPVAHRGPLGDRGQLGQLGIGEDVVAEPEHVGQPGDLGPLLEAPTAAVLASARTWWPSPSASASWRPAGGSRRA